MNKEAKIVALKTNEEENEEFRRSWEAHQKEREQFAINDAELDAILGELIDALDQHLIESAFNFRIGLDDSAGHGPNVRIFTNSSKNFVPTMNAA